MAVNCCAEATVLRPTTNDPAPEESVPKLVPGNEAHGLRNGVKRDLLLLLDSSPPHLDRELLVVRVALARGSVVRQQQQDILRQDAALLNPGGAIPCCFVNKKTDGEEYEWPFVSSNKSPLVAS